MNAAERARAERDLCMCALSDLLVALGYEAPSPPRLLEVAAEAAAHARQPSLLEAS